MAQPSEVAARADQALLVNEKQVEALVDLSGKTIKRRIREGKFPAPIVIGRVKRWSRQVIQEWVAQQAAQASKANPIN